MFKHRSLSGLSVGGSVGHRLWPSSGNRSVGSFFAAHVLVGFHSGWVPSICGSELSSRYATQLAFLWIRGCLLTGCTAGDLETRRFGELGRVMGPRYRQL